MYGPLEYVVIGFDGNRFTGEILPKLIEIERQGCVRLVDLVFVSKDEASNLTLMEISELGEEDAAAYEPLINEFHGLLSAEDVAAAGGQTLGSGFIHPEDQAEVIAEVMAAPVEDNE